MAVNAIWRGDALAVAQVTTLTVGGTIEIGDIFNTTIGAKTISVVAATTVANSVATQIAAAITAAIALPDDYPEFADLTVGTPSGGAFTLTAGTAGLPFTVTLTTTETGGGAADAQTYGQSATTACTGPNFWDNAANWSTGIVPVSTDTVYIQKGSVPILYGLAQSAVTLAALYIDQDYTGTIGLPRINSDQNVEYIEYRARYLAISATAVFIGRNTGSGSGRILLDTGTNATTINIYDTGRPLDDGERAVQWKGVHGSNAVYIQRGSFAAGAAATEAFTLPTLKQGFRDSAQSDTDVYLGANGTLTDITKTGGTLSVNSATTTLSDDNGETEINAGAHASIANTGSTIFYKSTGTCGAYVGDDGSVLDCRQDLRGRTFTQTTLRGSAKLFDPAKTVTDSNPIIVVGRNVEIDKGDLYNVAIT